MAAPGTTQNVAIPVWTGTVVGAGSATETHATDINTTGNGHQRYDFEGQTYKFGA